MIPADGIGAAAENGTSARPAGSSTIRLHQLAKARNRVTPDDFLNDPDANVWQSHPNCGAYASDPISMMRRVISFEVGCAADESDATVK